MSHGVLAKNLVYRCGAHRTIGGSAARNPALACTSDELTMFMCPQTEPQMPAFRDHRALSTTQAFGLHSASARLLQSASPVRLFETFSVRQTSNMHIESRNS